MSKSMIPIVAVAALAAVAAVFGMQSTTTVAPTPNSEVTITTSEDSVQAQGQTTQARPNGESRTTVEGTISQDEASVRIERTDKIDLPEVENPLDGISDTIGQIGETTQDLKEQYDALTGN